MTGGLMKSPYASDIDERTLEAPSNVTTGMFNDRAAAAEMISGIAMPSST